MTKIEIENVSMHYEVDDRSFFVLENINLHLQDGEFVSIIGPSGCGKSTLIDIIAGLKKPSQGEVRVGGKKVQGPGPDLGIVFQDYSLFPWMTSYENLYFAIEHTNENSSKGEMSAKAKKYLDIVGLSNFSDKFPNTLSGGMRQRLAIARMFATDPKIFLMDEPFGALDALNRIHMQDLLLYLWSRGHSRETTLYVTHDVDEAILLSDKIVILTPSPGKIKDIIDVEFERPRCRSNLVKCAEYIRLRSDLLSILNEEMLDALSEQEKHMRDLA
ncbi:ABC transporter ATP-binding protein [Methanobacterium alkalithermotolerans]|uniref:ABC transporter ATP-binding protein n=1 Tax=Methanobacterium alkalithermotolerans TaxID=2731220 RepID=A0A8T8K262_9EURY|nr:ABC transporter ATP-binding protein [Methanobacterium alkalithermotolerans]QUH22498.1 ABC transporter ATP-binding protein [Methanobacterium alkalithermotolerans]RJS49429.1 MAG: sulfonate ABC transporter ATP-binding protein [Methanobacterium sp.]